MDVMSLDFVNGHLGDVLLDVAGYLSAGLFWMLIYHTISARRRTSAPSFRERPAGPETVNAKKNARTGEAPRVQFIEFHQKAAESPSHKSDELSTETPDSGRRNRGEIIRIAREMLKNGVTSDRIRQVLPISDGELALLRQSNQ